MNDCKEFSKYEVAEKLGVSTFELSRLAQKLEIKPNYKPMKTDNGLQNTRFFNSLEVVVLENALKEKKEEKQNKSIDHLQDSVKMGAKEFNNVQKGVVREISKEIILDKSFSIYGTIENPLFLAKDVASWIGHSDVSKMVRSVDTEEKVANIVPTLGGNQKALFLTENGLYEVLMLSRKPIAKVFKKEVKKILHSLRLNGGYIANQENLTPEQIVANALIVAKNIISEKDKLLEEQNEKLIKQKPKVEVYDDLIARGAYINFRDCANECKITQSEFMTFLKSKFIYKKSESEYRCYAEYSEYFALRPYRRGEFVKQQLMLTLRGVAFFKNLICKKEERAKNE